MKTLTNFRDLGGIQNRDGKKVLPNKLLRSGELSRVSPEDQKTLLQKYNLGTVIDLRSQDEVDSRPDKLIEGTEYCHFDIFKDTSSDASSMESFSEINTTEKAHTYLNNTYELMAVDPGAQSEFTKMIQSVLETVSEKSALFHCFAGKDRTGVSASLLLEILNVPRETIYEDFLATNELRIEENMEIVTMAKDKGAEPGTLEALEVALNVDKQYLDTYYRVVEQQFGSIQEYIKNELQITEEMQDELRSALLSD